MVLLCLLNPQIWLEVKSAASLLIARGLGAKSTAVFSFLLQRVKGRCTAVIQSLLPALESSCAVQSLLHLEGPISKEPQCPILLFSLENCLINCFSIRTFSEVHCNSIQRWMMRLFPEWTLYFNLNSSFIADIFTVGNHLHSQLWLNNPSSWDS